MGGETTIHSVPDDVTDAFAALLVQARRKAGLSQEQLAALSGVDRTSISKLERGINAPSLRTVILLAGGLGLEPDDLTPRLRWRPSPAATAPAGELVEI